MRKYGKLLICFIIMLSSATYIYGDQVGNDQTQAFEKTDEGYIENLEGNVILYDHLASGAQVIHVENKDPNKVFAIGFKTPIHDNTGVNHIVEHAVFTGSEKYNMKDVFFHMKKKSPSIFMNASTAADMTIYPFSTRNSQDYSNLLDVYLDAVFFPNLQKKRYGFDQEGWHYTIDQDDEFHLSGVVYNEMKGASVVPRRILAMANRFAMFPDTMYIYNAGGNPEEIPQLTYEAFKKTHETYYIPSNSCAFIYGDADIEMILEKLDGYYSRFTKQEAQNISQKQVPFKKTAEYKEFYPAAHQNDGCFLSLNYAVDGIENIKLQLSMEILMDLLVQYDQSPLKKAFNSQQSSKTLSYDIDAAIPQPMYSIIATDVRQEDVNKVGVLIQNTLRKTAQDGFETKLIDMAINQYEIREKQRLSSASKGVDMAYASLYSWGHGVSPIQMLKRQELMDQIKEEGDSAYFQGLLQKYLLDNHHRSQVVLEPDMNYISSRQEKEIKQIKQASVNKNLEEKEKIKDNKKALQQWQNKEELSTLPQLTLEDISQPSPLPKLSIRENKGYKKLYYIANTKDMVYLDLYFDTSYIPQESIHDLFLFSYLIGEMEKDLVALYTGGMTASAIGIPSFQKHNDYKPTLQLSLSTKKDNIDKAFDILKEMTHQPKGWDEKWILTQIYKIRHQYEDYFNTQPLDMMNVVVHNTQEGAGRYEYEKMLPFYQYICTISENYDSYKDPLIKKLKIIDQSIFNKDQIILGATLEENHIQDLDKVYSKYVKKLNGGSYEANTYNFDIKNKKQGFPIPSDVQYIVWGGNYKQAGGSYHGALYVLANILNTEYMLENARVKNGAYGAGINFNPYGTMSLYTYQDPQLTQTLQTIRQVPDYIRKIEFAEDELEGYKIGAMSNFEKQLGLNDNPKVIGNILQKNYLSGISYGLIKQTREEILQATLEDIQGYGPVVERMIQEERYSIAGSENRLLNNSKHFDVIETFQKMYNYFI